MRRRTNLRIKITASKEQVFRLRDCSEDDTLFIERTGVSFGALVFEPFLLTQERFLLILLNFVVLFQSA